MERSKMHIMNLVILVLWSPLVLAADPDLSILEDQVTVQSILSPREQDYSQVKKVIMEAEKKWDNRSLGAIGKRKSYEKQFASVYVKEDEVCAREDEEVAKKGIEYCKNQHAAWKKRRQELICLENSSIFYKKMTGCLESSQTTESIDPLWQTAITILHNQMQALFASYYRLIKQENSAQIYENSYVGLGWLKIGYNSACRKAVRVYNGKGLIDQANTFEEQLTIFQNFKTAIETNQNVIKPYHMHSIDWIPIFLQNPYYYHYDCDKLRTFLAELVLAADLTKISQ